MKKVLHTEKAPAAIGGEVETRRHVSFGQLDHVFLSFASILDESCRNGYLSGGEASISA